MALHVNQPGPKAGDWLTFAGALIGVVFTITGTLWLESYRSKASERENRDILLGTLNEILDALERVRMERGAAGIGPARLQRIADESSLLKVFDKYIYARHYVPKRNIEAWQATEKLQSEIERLKPLIMSQLGRIHDSGDSEEELRLNILEMQHIFKDLIGPLNEARQIVRSHEI